MPEKIPENRIDTLDQWLLKSPADALVILYQQAKKALQRAYSKKDQREKTNSIHEEKSADPPIKTPDDQWDQEAASFLTHANNLDKEKTDKEIRHPLLSLYENKDYFPALVQHFPTKDAGRTDFSSQAPLDLKDASLADLAYSPSFWEWNHPAHRFSRLKSVLGFGYRPFHDRNIPYQISTPSPKSPADLRLIRMGMPIYGRTEIENRFKAYCLAQHRDQSQIDPSHRKPYSHLYLNYLKRSFHNPYTHRPWYDLRRWLWPVYNFFKHFERNQEYLRSQAIHALEKESRLGVAVVSLPADAPSIFYGYEKKSGRFHAKNDSEQRTAEVPQDPRLNVRFFLEELKKDIWQGNNDFFFSDSVKKALGWMDPKGKQILLSQEFLEKKDDQKGSDPHEFILGKVETVFEHDLQTLFLESVASVMDQRSERIRVLDVHKHSSTQNNPPQLEFNTSLSAEERMAVFFDLTKYRLPKFLAQNLRVSSMNMSCKDGIDRAGVATTWYLLQERLEQYQQNNPQAVMTQQEFLTHLQAPALLVKARTVNEHRYVLWHVLYAQYRTHPEWFSGHFSWVKDWLASPRNQAPGHSFQAIKEEQEQKTDERPTPRPIRYAEEALRSQTGSPSLLAEKSPVDDSSHQSPGPST